MTAALRWLWSHWYIPVLALVGFAGFVFGARSRCPSPLSVAKGELEAVDAGERARVLEIEKGRAEATAAADHEYRRTIDALDAAQSRKAARLIRDPARRARFLARVSRRRPTDPT